VTVADLGNGHLDIITTNGHAGTVSVLLGNGNGTFQPALTFTVGGDPASVVVADVDGDGTPDLLVANYGSDTVSVLLGNGHGAFQPARNFAVGGTNPNSIAVADINGDGIPDLITADYTSNDVSVLLGNGDGTFQTARTLPVGNHPFSVTVGDLGNGHVDIFVANAGENIVSVLLGNGDGTFAAAANFPVGNYPLAVAVADLGNRHLDIVTTSGKSNTVSVLLGDGHGSFQPHLDFPVGSKPVSIAVADVNGDGIPDIVTANYSGNDVSVLLGNGNGSFVPSGLFVPIIPLHLAAAVLLDVPSVGNIPAQPLSQPPSVAFSALASTVTSGWSAQPQQPSESSGAESAPLPAWLAAQPEPINLPTERDILADIDIATLLRTWSRPRANLVPQPHDPAGAIAELQLGDLEDGTARRGEPGAFPVRKGLEMWKILISPVENTVIGPSSPPRSATPERRRSQGQPNSSDRMQDPSIQGRPDGLPAASGLGAKPVPGPASPPKEKPRDRPRAHLLMLPLLLGGLLHSALSCSQMPRIKRKRRSMVTVT
jgi:hypothetical protein